MKSEPELCELIELDQRLSDPGVEVKLSGKGFGTQVVIRVSPNAGLDVDDLEAMLDNLAEPQKRPFTAT